MIYLGDCLEVMKEFKDNSVTACITDPPAGIAFMGKAWDKDKGGRERWIAWLSEIMAEVLRVLKPGGMCLVWSIPRTSHWTGTALEDAGFEIRDKIYHLFGSGFPKSLDISKAIDKKNGSVREVVGEYKFPDGTIRTVKRKANKNTMTPAIEGTTKHTNITAPATDEAKAWDGYGTGLKPAAEEWWLAMKPLDGTFIENALKWGVAGINVDGCRVGTWENDPNKRPNNKNHTHTKPVYCGNSLLESKTVPKEFEYNKGRWPANVVLNEEAAEMLDEQSGVLVSKWGKPKGNAHLPVNRKGQVPQNQTKEYAQKYNWTVGDKGGASRFMKNIKVDLVDISMYNTNRIIKLKETLCGNIIANQKVGGILNGVIKEAEKYIQSVEQFLFGNNIMKNFQMDMKPIISTLIKKMTEFKTYNAFLAENIDYFTVESEKTIKLLMGLNTEDVKNAENIKPLIIFGNELLELLEDIVRIAQELKEKNGLKRTETTIIPICENIKKGIKNNPRFFYCAKPSKRERNAGCEGLETKIRNDGRDEKLSSGNMPQNRSNNPKQNHHPTVKPLKLMEYFIKLLSPPEGGVIIDPFMGSGTTGVACKGLNREFIGIEKNPEYFEIAKNRIENTKPQIELNV